MSQAGRYDRQERTIGKDAMQYIFNTKCLIVGLNGLGAEVAKNLVLMGVRKISLLDSKCVSVMDLSSQFFLHEQESLGKNRASETASKVQELNDMASIEVLQGPLTEDMLLNFTVCFFYFVDMKIVIFCDDHIPLLTSYNEYCRKHGIYFVAAEVRGLAGALFVDLGNEWQSKEPSSQNPSSGAIIQIKVDERGHGLVETFDKTDVVNKPTVHGLYTGDLVMFKGIEGMTELNNAAPIPVTVVDNVTFDIGNVSKLGMYTGGGYYYQVNSAKTFHFVCTNKNM